MALKWDTSSFCVVAGKMVSDLSPFKVSWTSVDSISHGFCKLWITRFLFIVKSLAGYCYGTYQASMRSVCSWCFFLFLFPSSLFPSGDILGLAALLFVHRVIRN